jgi:glycerate kinase
MSAMAHTVVIAPDSFKGTIAAAAAAAALAAGWLSEAPDADVRLLPMADGGEGTIDAFAAAVPGARRMAVTVTGPENSPVAASWLLLPPTTDAPHGTGVVELASTSGIELLGSPPRLRALDVGTHGFGEAIAAALAHGVSRLVLGIGSSASTDGGAGMLIALGAKVMDAAGRPVVHGGRGLADVARVDLSGLPPLPVGGVQVLSDVTNPLLGERGAAAVFGPQKGATAGAGAAGGTGFGLLAWGAELVAGSDAVAELIGLDAAIAAADVVVTGEGSFDGQSAAGKVPAHVSALAATHSVPAALVAGRITADADITAFAAAESLTAIAGSAEAAMAMPARYLHSAGASIARGLQVD